MNTNILSENSLNCQELERRLNLLNTVLKAFLREPEDLNRYANLMIEKLKVERLLHILLYPEIEATGECISPSWEDIGVVNQNTKKVNQNLEMELSLLKKQRENKQMPRRRKHNSNLSISNVLDMAGVVVKRGFILCPFHEERNPSCKIYPHSNTFYCFACGKYGTAYDLAIALGVLG